MSVIHKNVSSAVRRDCPISRISCDISEDDIPEKEQQEREVKGLRGAINPSFSLLFPRCLSGRTLYLFQPSQSKMWVEIPFGPP